MSTFRGYSIMQEELARIRPLCESIRKARPEITFIRLGRKQYDLFKRWPSAGKAQNPPIEYREGEMFYLGFLLGHDKTIGRYEKPAVPEQRDIESFEEKL